MLVNLRKLPFRVGAMVHIAGYECRGIDDASFLLGPATSDQIWRARNAAGAIFGVTTRTHAVCWHCTAKAKRMLDEVRA